MAKIPMGDFGNSVVQARPTPTASAGQLDGGLGAAGERLGNTAMAIAGQEIAQQRAEERRVLAQAEAERKQDADKQARRAEQVQQLSAHADIQNGLADLSDQITAGVADGSLPRAEARKQWTESSQKLLGERIGKLPPDLGELVGAQMKGLAGTLNNRLEDGIRKRDKEEADGGLITYREQLQRFAGTDMDGAVQQWTNAARMAGPAAGWTPERIEKEINGFREGVNYTRAYEVVSASRNNRGALDVAEKTISQMADLDPQKKAALLDRTAGYKFSLDQRAELAAQRAQRQQEAHLKKAEAAFQTFQGVSDKGLAMDPAYVDAAVQATQGTPYQAGIKALAKQAVDTGGLASQTLPQQRAALDAVTAQIARDGNSPALAKRRDQVEKVVRGSETDMKADPLRAYLDRSPEAATFAPLDASSLQGLTKSLGDRMPIAARASQWSGGPVAPLTAEEIEPVRTLLDALPAAQRSAAVAALATTVGPQAAAGMAHQLDKKDRALGLAFGMAGAQTPQGRYTSELVLKGAQAKKDGTSTRNKETADVKDSEWTRFMTTELEGVYSSPQITNAVRDAAVYIAHGLAAEKSGRLREADMRKAVRLAAGGEIVEHNGKKIPLPSGIDEDMLGKRLRSVSAQEIASQVAPLPGNAAGMVEAGNIDLGNRPKAKNSDGSISTVRSMGVNIDGKEVLIPTVVNGKVVSDDAAIAEFRKTGKHLGKFNSPQASTAYAETLHKQQENASFVRAAGVPVPMDEFVAKLPGAELVYAGPGRFNVLAGGRPVMSADGKSRITIGVR